MSTKYSLRRDLDELERMVERLHEYLLGDALYLPVGGGSFRGGGAPQLTLGALLLRRRRLPLLRAKLKRADALRLDDALSRHEGLQREWTLHYERKLRRELPSRLKLMARFFRDCGESPQDCAGGYPIEALRRTIAQEILLALGEFGCATGMMLEQVQQTDAALRRLLHAADFIWSPQLAPAYPRETFWWLYGNPAA